MFKENSVAVKDKIISFNKKSVYTGKSQKGYGHTCFVKRQFKVGDIVMKGFGKKIDHQTAHSSV